MSVKRFAIFLALFCALSIPAVAQSPSLSAKLDSAYIQMGRVTRLHLEALGNLSDQADILPADTGWVQVEKVSLDSLTRSDMGHGRVRLTRDIVIQSFDSGLHIMPPVYLIDGGETLSVTSAALKVVPVDVDSLSTIHDYAPVTAYPRHFFDFLPDWLVDWGLWVILGLVIASGVIIWLLKRTKRTPEERAEARRLPPYEEALEALDTLKNRKLCERGQEKEFYTGLVDILRVYLQRRFGINAMEMTSTEIRHALDSNEHTRPSRSIMNRVLEMADFVKFAKMRPMPEDNVASFKSAVEFVEQTKPVPEPPTADRAEDVPPAPESPKI